MKLKMVPAVYLLTLVSLHSLDIELSAGPAYAFYGIHSETSAVGLDMGYQNLGIDLGGAFRLSREWDVQGHLYLGEPLAGRYAFSDGTTSIPEFSSYDSYRYHLLFSLGSHYRKEKGSWTFSAGPHIVVSNLVLASQDNDPAHILSYTGGLALKGRIMYKPGAWGVYADVTGTYGLGEILVTHDDFSHSYGAEFSMGVLWSL